MKVSIVNRSVSPVPIVTRKGQGLLPVQQEVVVETTESALADAQRIAQHNLFVTEVKVAMPTQTKKGGRSKQKSVNHNDEGGNNS